MRRSARLLLPCVAGASATAAAPPPELAADLRDILVRCEIQDSASPPVAAIERTRPYGTIAFAPGHRPCDISFELVAANMADVHRIVAAWVRRRDPGATYRDPRVSGGKRAIWAMKGSTLRLDFGEAPNRGRLSISPFPANR